MIDMELLNFDNRETFSIRSADSILSVFNSDRKQLSLINYDMSIDEVSDIISDKLIEVVQSQFDAIAKKLSEGQSSNT